MSAVPGPETWRSKKIHFVGIGGIGMSALAQLASAHGATVSGSDRNFDRGVPYELFDILLRQGMRLTRQDGSAIGPETSFLVASAAIEPDNPDLQKAGTLGVPVYTRAAFQAALYPHYRSLAVTGTSGKTTVTAMLGHILKCAGVNTAILVGGFMKNYASDKVPGNVIPGKGLLCIEVDESDGAINYISPHIGVITNITKDHKDLPELRKMFRDFAARVNAALIYNADCPEATGAAQYAETGLTYSCHGPADFRATDVEFDGLSASFRVRGTTFRLNLPGEHNVSNALAAIAAAEALGVELEQAAAALASFTGVKRRLEIVGEARGVRIIDDYAHNPQKIAASLKAVQKASRRMFAIYQPHGFAPTRLAWNELIETFCSVPRRSDVIFLLDIFYAGGTTVRDISSADLAKACLSGNAPVVYVQNRNDLVARIAHEAQPGDVILVMGARDVTLTDFCREILSALEQ